MEQIYTIPVNEAFEKGMDDHSLGCPFCRLRDGLNKNEIDLILGASMMEPDTRKKTNEQGFCRAHFTNLLSAGKRLPLALILESHLTELSKMTKNPFIAPAVAGHRSAKKLSFTAGDCYICRRLDDYLSKMLKNAAFLWGTDPEFRKKYASQSYICMEHFSAFLVAGKETLDRKTFADFYKALYQKQSEQLKKISDDISFFISKFDYRHGDDPWNGRENAPEDAIDFICGSKEP